jgi:gluconokinase
MHALVQDLTTKSQRAVITCSALKQAYREWFTDCDPHVSVVYLRGAYALIHPRLRARTMHFMKPDLLASQFSALEEPRDIPFVDVAQAPEVIVEQIKRMLHLVPA